MALSYILRAGEAQQRAWTSQTSSGKCWSLLSQIHLKEKMGEGQALARPSRCAKRNLVDTAYRCALERPTRALPTLPDLPSALSEVGRRRSPEQRTRSSSPRPRRAGRDRPIRVLHRRHVCCGQKRGACVGKTKRGKGTKIMAFSDGSSIALSVHTERVLHRTKSPLLDRLWQVPF